MQDLLTGAQCAVSRLRLLNCANRAKARIASLTLDTEALSPDRLAVTVDNSRKHARGVSGCDPARRAVDRRLVGVWQSARLRPVSRNSATLRQAQHRVEDHLIARL